MRRIRALVYRLGFRPKPGSIFFSPSKALEIRFQEELAMVENGDQTFNEVRRRLGLPEYPFD